MKHLCSFPYYQYNRMKRHSCINLIKITQNCKHVCVKITFIVNLSGLFHEMSTLFYWSITAHLVIIGLISWSTMYPEMFYGYYITWALLITSCAVVHKSLKRNWRKDKKLHVSTCVGLCEHFKDHLPKTFWQVPSTLEATPNLKSKIAAILC